MVAELFGDAVGRAALDAGAGDLADTKSDTNRLEISYPQLCILGWIQG